MAFPALAFGQTSQAVMDKAIANLIGPAGMMVVSEGRMQFSRRDLETRTARYFHEGTEGFQMDILSPLEDQEVPGATPQTDKKYRVIRTGRKISTLAYLPSLRRGRKINYVPLDGLLGSDFTYYLLPLVSDLMHDFSYSFMKEDPQAPIILGVQKEGSRSPYSEVELHLQARGERYLIPKAIYKQAENTFMTVVAEEFLEYTDDYWLPTKMLIGDTTLTFDMWTTTAPQTWLHATNHNLFDAQRIPNLRTSASN